MYKNGKNLYRSNRYEYIYPDIYPDKVSELVRITYKFIFVHKC